jgi:hypothetical protein
VAAAAEAAEAAGVADTAEAAAAAVCRGELAASARPDSFTITLTNARRHGRVRQGRPGLFVSSFRRCPGVYAGASAHDDQVDLQPHRETPARELDEEIPVAGVYALHRRSGVVVRSLAVSTELANRAVSSICLAG